MRITTKQLKRIISEELNQTNEGLFGDFISKQVTNLSRGVMSVKHKKAVDAMVVVNDYLIELKQSVEQGSFDFANQARAMASYLQQMINFINSFAPPISGTEGGPTNTTKNKNNNNDDDTEGDLSDLPTEEITEIHKIIKEEVYKSTKGRPK